eukprot:CAMPEP_0177323870 /NCGR_PEP_ID=MMETSP0368-20130122/16973_1 /TAXON_ID=447022 ORGANISM="Scrippsiella hangoei-like, Strain SHHI-4" /NCGR_SAMPLE_ID=MMETSP0368 /ASSEMBLY_ACC=CAM_ASM_000363 /LENGTH=232 /DNA_ID=CAMNT_0018783665 /DNA_START=1 /DNA_END=700 /DNA_ORIENTATION=-
MHLCYSFTQQGSALGTPKGVADGAQGSGCRDAVGPFHVDKDVGRPGGRQAPRGLLQDGAGVASSVAASAFTDIYDRVPLHHARRTHPHKQAQASARPTAHAGRRAARRWSCAVARAGLPEPEVVVVALAAGAAATPLSGAETSWEYPKWPCAAHYEKPEPGRAALLARREGFSTASSEHGAFWAESKGTGQSDEEQYRNKFVNRFFERGLNGGFYNGSGLAAPKVTQPSVRS